jgi:hypothetical protein
LAFDNKLNTSHPLAHSICFLIESKKAVIFITSSLETEKGPAENHSFRNTLFRYNEAYKSTGIYLSTPRCVLKLS